MPSQLQTALLIALLCILLLPYVVTLVLSLYYFICNICREKALLKAHPVHALLQTAKEYDGHHFRYTVYSVNGGRPAITYDGAVRLPLGSVTLYATFTETEAPEEALRPKYRRRTGIFRQLKELVTPELKKNAQTGFCIRFTAEEGWSYRLRADAAHNTLLLVASRGDEHWEQLFS